MTDGWLLTGLPLLTAWLAKITGSWIYREYRRRHPKFPIAAVTQSHFDRRFCYLNERHRDLPLQQLGEPSLVAYRVPEDPSSEFDPMLGSQQAA